MSEVPLYACPTAQCASRMAPSMLVVRIKTSTPDCITTRVDVLIREPLAVLHGGCCPLSVSGDGGRCLSVSGVPAKGGAATRLLRSGGNNQNRGSNQDITPVPSARKARTSLGEGGDRLLVRTWWF